jgi:hypothetical protein
MHRSKRRSLDHCKIRPLLTSRRCTSRGSRNGESRPRVPSRRASFYCLAVVTVHTLLSASRLISIQSKSNSQNVRWRRQTVIHLTGSRREWLCSIDLSRPPSLPLC